MTTLPLVKVTALACGAIAALAAPAAQASSQFALVPQALAMVSLSEALPCEPRATALAAPVKPLAMIQKSSAILGGKPSQLELLRMQQAGVQASGPAAITLVSTPAPTAIGCATAGSETGTTHFIQPEVRLALHRAPAVMPKKSEDFLASKRLSIRSTAFDAQWNRVRASGLNRRLVTKHVGAMPGKVTTATLEAVNAWTNRNVRFVEDRQLYGKSDYWATASATLRRSAGDCEDIAIAKMQILAALGVPHSAMYLTVARDLARNADHALLVVELDGQHWVLDNATDRLLDGRYAHDYRPVYSFSGTAKWLHGYAEVAESTLGESLSKGT